MEVVVAEVVVVETAAKVVNVVADVQSQLYLRNHDSSTKCSSISSSGTRRGITSSTVIVMT